MSLEELEKRARLDEWRQDRIRCMNPIKSIQMAADKEPNSYFGWVQGQRDLITCIAGDDAKQRLITSLQVQAKLYDA